MKKIFFALSLIGMFAIAACGPSQKDKEKQKKTDDSAFEPERNSILDKANKQLSDTSTVKVDSAKKKKK